MPIWPNLGRFPPFLYKSPFPFAMYLARFLQLIPSQWQEGRIPTLCDLKGMGNRGGWEGGKLETERNRVCENPVIRRHRRGQKWPPLKSSRLFLLRHANPAQNLIYIYMPLTKEEIIGPNSRVPPLCSAKDLSFQASRPPLLPRHRAKRLRQQFINLTSLRWFSSSTKRGEG